jgi:hypothetical protein
MTDLVMKYLAKESDQRPDVSKMMTNQFVGDHKPSPDARERPGVSHLFELTRDRWHGA